VFICPNGPNVEVLANPALRELDVWSLEQRVTVVDGPVGLDTYEIQQPRARNLPPGREYLVGLICLKTQHAAVYSPLSPFESKLVLARVPQKGQHTLHGVVLDQRRP
jgi:hypothetical protein